MFNFCASLIAIDKDKLNNVEDSIKNSDPSIDTVEIEVDCRIIKITMISHTFPPLDKINGSDSATTVSSIGIICCTAISIGNFESCCIH